MRIRIFQAFASNNSGSYTIVGSFSSAEVAEETAQLLRTVCAEHSAWFEKHAYQEAGESPLDVFARAQGLSEERPGRSDDWPEHGDPASVLAVGHQVLVHAPYTITMPRLFGEFFYKRGGRVDVELDHSHEDLAVEIAFYVPGIQWNDPERQVRIEAMERALVPVLPPLVERSEHDRRSPIAPVFHGGDRGNRYLSAVFRDLVSGVEAVRRVAVQHGIALQVRVTESAHGSADPLAHVRPSNRPWGNSRVILWSIGPDRIRAMKGVREAIGADLAGAKTALEDLPKELLAEVDHAYAERAVEVLRAAGCDAEAVIPRRGSR